jgi:hypothetical protein
MKNRHFLVFILGFLTFSSLQAQKFVNEFLNIGVGARNQGMFGAVTSHVNDGTAAYWNVAGLASIQDNLQLNAMHSKWFGGVANYDYFSVAKRLNMSKNAVGAVSIIRLGVDNIPNTLNLVGPDGSIDFSRVTSFAASDLAGIVSYAQKLGRSDRLSVGANIKIIRRSIGEFGDAWGVGADVGAQYKLSDNISLGVMAKDITTTVNSWTFNLKDEDKQVFTSTGNTIPLSSTEITLPRLILGGGYKLDRGKFIFLGEVNLNISTDGTEAAVLSGNNINVDPTFGVEVGYDNRVFVRGGLGNIQSVINPANTAQKKFEIQPNIGLGLNLGRIKIDYALANLGSVSGVQISHIFSASLGFVPRS